MDYENEEDDFLEQAQRKAKRTYLREEVLDMGFSAQRFQSFCERDKGADIDLWTFEELQDCVTRFKAKEAETREEGKTETRKVEEGKRPESPKTQKVLDSGKEGKSHLEQAEKVHLVQVQSSPLDSPTASPTTVPAKAAFFPEKVKEMAIVLSDSPKVPISPSLPIVKEALAATRPVHLPPDPIELPVTPSALVSSQEYSTPGPVLPASRLSEEANRLEIVLESHEIVPGGLLSSSYVLYTVRTEPLAWVVKRRFNDFFWLRGVLQTQFPGYYVAPIPKKQNTGRLAEETILKRSRFLGRFMESIVRTPAFLRSQWLLAFLGETGLEQFQATKKATTKFRRPDRVEDFPTLSGSHLLNDSLSTEYLQACNDLLSHSEILKKRLKRQSQSLLNTLKSLNEQLQGVAETYKSLSELQDSLGAGSKELFAGLSEVFRDWSGFEGHLYEAVYDHMDTFYKFRYQEMTVLKDLLRERDVYLSAYLKADERLNSRKERLWTQADPSKWELDSDSALDSASLTSNKSLATTLMLPKDTATVGRAKDLFAYYNAMAFLELRRVAKEVTGSERRNALALVLRQTELAEDLRRTLGTLTTSIAALA